LALEACDLNDRDPREVPILADLTQYQGSFTSTLTRSAVDVTGIPVELHEPLGKGAPLLVLCDDFHSCSDKRRFFQQARDWLATHRESRIVVFSHDIPAIDTLLAGGIPVFDLQSLPDIEILRIFKNFLNDPEAFSLYDELSSRGDLDAFRTPLLATLLAIAQSQTEAVSNPPLTKRGQLFRRVVIEGVLGTWAAQRQPELINALFNETLRAGAAMSALLLRSRSRSLPIAQVVAHIPGNLPANGWEMAIDAGVVAGVFRRRRDEIGFSHDALRDYFAAEYLLQAAPRAVLTAWWSPDWRGALGLFASLWAGDRKRMFWLRLAAWLSFRRLVVLHVGASRRATELFYFMLDFAAEAGPACSWLQRRLWFRYRVGETYLSDDADVRHRAFFDGWENRLAHVYRLFGRMSDEDIQAWLRNADDRRRYRVHGIGQNRTLDGVEELLRSVGSDKDGIADDAAVELAFEFPSELLKEAFRRVSAEPDGVAHLLHVLVKTREWQRHKGDRISSVMRSDPFWRDTLLELLLEGDDDVFREARSALHCLYDDAWLGADVEDFLVAELSSEAPHRRARAAWTLVMARSATSLEALQQIVGESDRAAGLAAAEALIFRDSERAPEYLLAWVVRWAAMDRTEYQRWAPIVDSIVATWIEARPTRQRYEDFARWFARIAFTAVDSSVRLVAARGLSMLRGTEITDMLQSILEQETSQAAQCAIAKYWGMHPDADLETVVALLTSHDNEAIRDRCAWMVWQRTDEELSAELWEKLRRLRDEDPSPAVRQESERYLRLIAKRTTAKLPQRSRES
jgi:hypothetical protein